MKFLGVPGVFDSNTGTDLTRNGNELSSRRCYFVVPTASSSNLLNGLPYPHHCDVSRLLASGVPIVPLLSSIFMLRCDRIPVMLTC